MLASDIITLVRPLIGVPAQPNGRWSDAVLLNMLDSAQKWLVQELLFPESRISIVTNPGQQYYSLPDTHRLLRVYLNGIPLIPFKGGIDQMEGRIYNQIPLATGYPLPGSDGPVGGGGVSQPAWSIEQQQIYPYIGRGMPSEVGPRVCGAMPQFYVRGGGIGLVPAPMNGSTISIDCVLVPPTLVSTTQTLEVPDFFREPLKWYLVRDCKFADDTQASGESAMGAEKKFQESVSKAQQSVDGYTMKNSEIFVVTNRRRYNFGRHRIRGW